MLDYRHPSSYGGLGLGEIGYRAYTPQPDLEGGHQYIPDEGCRLHPSCLSCPLEKCVYDKEGHQEVIEVFNRAKHRARAEAVTRYMEQGVPRVTAVYQTAWDLGVEPRTVYRSIQKVRESSNGP